MNIVGGGPDAGQQLRQRSGRPQCARGGRGEADGFDPAPGLVVDRLRQISVLVERRREQAVVVVEIAQDAIVGRIGGRQSQHRRQGDAVAADPIGTVQGRRSDRVRELRHFQQARGRVVIVFGHRAEAVDRLDQPARTVVDVPGPAVLARHQRPNRGDLGVGRCGGQGRQLRCGKRGPVGDRRDQVVRRVVFELGQRTVGIDLRGFAVLAIVEKVRAGADRIGCDPQPAKIVIEVSCRSSGDAAPGLRRTDQLTRDVVGRGGGDVVRRGDRGDAGCIDDRNRRGDPIDVGERGDPAKPVVDIGFGNGRRFVGHRIGAADDPAEQLAELVVDVVGARPVFRGDREAGHVRLRPAGDGGYIPAVIVDRVDALQGRFVGDRRQPGGQVALERARAGVEVADVIDRRGLIASRIVIELRDASFSRYDEAQVVLDIVDIAGRQRTRGDPWLAVGGVAIDVQAIGIDRRIDRHGQHFVLAAIGPLGGIPEHVFADRQVPGGVVVVVFRRDQRRAVEHPDRQQVVLVRGIGIVEIFGRAQISAGDRGRLDRFDQTPGRVVIQVPGLAERIGDARIAGIVGKRGRPRDRRRQGLNGLHQRRDPAGRVVGDGQQGAVGLRDRGDLLGRAHVGIRCCVGVGVRYGIVAWAEIDLHLLQPVGSVVAVQRARQRLVGRADEVVVRRDQRNEICFDRRRGQRVVAVDQRGEAGLPRRRIGGRHLDQLAGGRRQIVGVGDDVGVGVFGAQQAAAQGVVELLDGAGLALGPGEDVGDQGQRIVAVGLVRRAISNAGGIREGDDRAVPVGQRGDAADGVGGAARQDQFALAVVQPVVGVAGVGAQAVVGPVDDRVGTPADENFVGILDDQIAGRSVDVDVVGSPAERGRTELRPRTQQRCRTALETQLGARQDCRHALHSPSRPRFSPPPGIHIRSFGVWFSAFSTMGDPMRSTSPRVE